MTDLTGVELDLAVARVMGHEARIGTQRTVSGKDVETVFVRYLHTREWRREWRPSQGGAAAWEVLEWLRRPDAAYWVSLETSPSHPSHCVITHGDCLETHGHGPTDAIALCRAVVALGELG